jgi:hypothetical protein
MGILVDEDPDSIKYMANFEIKTPVAIRVMALLKIGSTFIGMSFRI